MKILIYLLMIVILPVIVFGGLNITQENTSVSSTHTTSQAGVYLGFQFVNNNINGASNQTLFNVSLHASSTYTTCLLWNSSVLTAPLANVTALSTLCTFNYQLTAGTTYFVSTETQNAGATWVDGSVAINGLKVNITNGAYKVGSGAVASAGGSGYQFTQITTGVSTSSGVSNYSTQLFNYYNNSLITNYSIQMTNGSYQYNFSTVNGRINTSVLNTDLKLWNVSFINVSDSSGAYFNTTLYNVNVSSNSSATTWQAELYLTATAKFSGAAVSSTTFTAPNGNTTTNLLRVNAGTFTINASATGWNGQSKSFTTTALSNTSGTFTNLTNRAFYVNISDFVDGSGVNNATVIITTNGVTDTNSTTNGQLILYTVDTIQYNISTININGSSGAYFNISASNVNTTTNLTLRPWQSELYLTATAKFSNMTISGSTFTAPNGNTSSNLLKLKQGSYVINASKAGYVTQSKLFNLNSLQNVSSNIENLSNSTIQIFAFNGTSNSSIPIFTGDISYNGVHEIIVASNGNITFNITSGLSYDIVLSAPGFTSYNTIISTSNNFTLNETGSNANVTFYGYEKWTNNYTPGVIYANSQIGNPLSLPLGTYNATYVNASYENQTQQFTYVAAINYNSSFYNLTNGTITIRAKSPTDGAFVNDFSVTMQYGFVSEYQTSSGNSITFDVITGLNYTIILRSSEYVTSAFIISSSNETYLIDLMFNPATVDSDSTNGGSTGGQAPTPDESKYVALCQLAPSTTAIIISDKTPTASVQIKSQYTRSVEIVARVLPARGYAVPEGKIIFTPAQKIAEAGQVADFVVSYSSPSLGEAALDTKMVAQFAIDGCAPVSVPLNIVLSESSKRFDWISGFFDYFTSPLKGVDSDTQIPHYAIFIASMFIVMFAMFTPLSDAMENGFFKGLGMFILTVVISLIVGFLLTFGWELLRGA